MVAIGVPQPLLHAPPRDDAFILSASSLVSLMSLFVSYLSSPDGVGIKNNIRKGLKGH